MLDIRKAISNFKVEVNKNDDEVDVKEIIGQLKVKINTKDAKYIGDNTYRVIIDLKSHFGSGSRAVSVGNKVVAAMKPTMDPGWTIEVLDYEGVQDSRFCELHFTFTI